MISRQASTGLPDMERIAETERRLKAGEVINVDSDEWREFVEHMQSLPDGSRAEGERQAHALLAAGWKMEIPSESAIEPWQWQWRSPPKRKNSKGRLYLSTNQAFNALKRFHP